MVAPVPKVIVSNGFGKFQLAVAAAELARADRLAMLLTGGYPRRTFIDLARRVRADRNPKVARLLARREPIPNHRVRAAVGPEILHELGVQATQRLIFRGAGPHLQRASQEMYGRWAARQIRTAPAAVYHYRAGFGHESVTAASKAGQLTLCDHSIAHPSVLEHLVEHKGELPREALPSPRDPYWLAILQDIGRADHVLVNSDFVRNTFLSQGWSADRVHVLYWGVDDHFLAGLRCLASVARNPDRPYLQLMFAGTLSARKGAGVLAEALGQVTAPWQLSIAGPIPPRERKQHQSFLEDDRVTELGNLSREDLAASMCDADTFVFPSLAEGSARVIFEAMASGCHVITTPNSGSIVQDGVHGRLVPPGDASALRTVIADTIAEPAAAREVGQRNADLVRRHYRQTNYGAGLGRLYDALARNP